MILQLYPVVFAEAVFFPAGIGRHYFHMYQPGVMLILEETSHTGMKLKELPLFFHTPAHVKNALYPELILVTVNPADLNPAVLFKFLDFAADIYRLRNRI